MTNKIYYKDAYISEFDAKVISCEKIYDGYEIILDKTAFFPTGGGQPCDTGVFRANYGVFDVLDVYEKGENVVHKTKNEMEVGSFVHGEIDFQKRFSLMQNHSGEHILSGIVHKNFGYNNVGFHMGESFVTVDFDGFLSDEECDFVEMQVNEIIYKNIEIISYFLSKKEIENLDFRSKKELSGEIRLIETPNIDLCACCGLHVKRTGEIGVVKIIERMKYKSGIRLSILSGFRAFSDYSAKNRDIYKISALLSRKPSEISEGVLQNLEEISRRKSNEDTLWKKYFNEKVKFIPKDVTNVCLFEDDCDNNNLRNLALKCLEKMTENNEKSVENMIAAVFSRDSEGYRYVLVSTSDVRPLNKALCEKFSGKGGGKAEICQGSISCEKCKKIIKEFVNNWQYNTK